MLTNLEEMQRQKRIREIGNLRQALVEIKAKLSGPHDGPSSLMAAGEAWSIANAALDDHQ